MPTPDLLFTSITIDTINEFIATNREEDLHLDFKAAKAAITRDDRRNFAIAASGFANSDGGIILWGIDAPGTNGATNKVPIQPLSTFLRQLQQHTGTAANPIVDGIQHRTIEEATDVGYVITLIPASDRGPHMAKLGEDRYYKRSGDRFAIMEHFDISDMFGRRARPALSLGYVLGSGSVLFSTPKKREARLTLSVTNEGRGSAIAPFVDLTNTGPFKIYPLGISVTADAQLITNANSGPARLIGNATCIIHPGTTYEIALLTAEFPDGSTIPDLTIHAAIAAVNQRLTEQPFTVTGASIRATIGTD